MTRDAFHAAIHAEPFVPFRVHLANGRTVDVTHPEWILHPPDGRAAVWMNPDGAYRVIDVGLVLELENLPQAVGSIAPNPNGGE